MYGKGTVAGCLSGGLGFGLAASFDLCVGIDKEGLFYSATASGPDESMGTPGVGLGLGIQVSNAPSSYNLNGKSSFVSGGAAGGYGSYAQSEDGQVHVYEGGAMFGTPWPGFSGGESNSGVLQFKWCDNWIGVCW
jgi:hypothetical protein